MPIEVTDILPEAAAAAEEVAPPDEETSSEATPEATPEAAPAPAPKKKGRPAGSKNKPKASSVAVTCSHLQSPAVTYSHPASEGEAASPPKAKAKPKAKATAAPAESVRVKRAAPKRVPPPVYESESEEEPPLSPMSQRRAQWAAYRQAQVDAHQARTSHYSKALDRMLAF